jgi:hypothetical protein
MAGMTPCKTCGWTALPGREICRVCYISQEIEWQRIEREQHNDYAQEQKTESTDTL